MNKFITELLNKIGVHIAYTWILSLLSLLNRELLYNIPFLVLLIISTTFLIVLTILLFKIKSKNRDLRNKIDFLENENKEFNDWSQKSIKNNDGLEIKVGDQISLKNSGNCLHVKRINNRLEFIEYTNNKNETHSHHMDSFIKYKQGNNFRIV